MSHDQNSAPRLFGKGVAAIVEQAASTGGMFAMHVLLARLLVDGGYDAFVTAFAGYLMAVNLYSGLWPEPVLLFLPGRFADRGDAYVRAVLRQQVPWAGLASIALAVFAGVAEVRGQRSLATAFVGAALFCPAGLLMLLARRVCYGRLRPGRAATGGFVYSIALVAGIVALWRLGSLSPLSAMSLLAAVSLVVAVALLGRDLAGGTVPAELAADVRSAHWSYGKWAALSGALRWAPLNLWYAVLPLAVGAGAGANGELRAAFNLVLPALQVNAAVATMLVSHFSRRRRQHARLGAARVAAPLLLASAGYWVAVAVGGDVLSALLYGDAYPDLATVLVPLGAVPVFTALVAVMQAVLLSAEKARDMFWIHLLTAAVAGSVGLAATLAYGLEGAAWGMVACYAVQAAAIAGLLVRRSRRIAVIS